MAEALPESDLSSQLDKRDPLQNFSWASDDEVSGESDFSESKKGFAMI